MPFESRDELIRRFSDRFSGGSYLERAVDAVLEGRVKKHVFTPSGRVIYTVVGRNGDEFIDPDKPFCSCEHFFFKVLGGKEEPCYHLQADSIAAETNRFSEIEFHDEEFLSFLRLLSHDLLSRSGSRAEEEPRP